MQNSGPLHTPVEAALLLRADVRSLERWRRCGNGPAFIKVGRRVAYAQADLDAFIEKQRRTCTAEARRAS